MPQNLTTWKIRVWAMGHGTRVGEASAEVVTRKNSSSACRRRGSSSSAMKSCSRANVHNYLPTAKQVKVRLELDGDTLELPPTPSKRSKFRPAARSASIGA